jgi:hypothetical protein
MSESDALTEFAREIRRQVELESSKPGDETFEENEFTRLMIDYLVDAGEISNGTVCHHKAQRIKINGYEVSDAEDQLDLFANVVTLSVPPSNVAKAEILAAIRRMEGFLDWAMRGKYKGVDESADVYDAAQRIESIKSTLRRVRMYVFTDGLSTIDKMPPHKVGPVEFSFHIWDVRRLHRCVSSGHGREPIRIDFQKEHGLVLECLAVDDNADYKAYLAIIPGKLLFDLYDTYSDRLLERNVRSFLQARGKVNKKIRETIKAEPHRFLAYNNGISATAADVELVDLPDKGKCIKALTDFQVVNGGQTMASIYQAVKRDKQDVSRVSVQAKISVVDSGRIDEIVPLISRYANSQNKVSEPDFSANDPYHRKIDELSRTIWTPTLPGQQYQTRWFYERARGQYLVARTEVGTPAKQKQFSEEHPTGQRFTKTDLAKFENTWSQLPHLVSRGGEKNFREFTIKLKERGPIEPDTAYFHDLVAKAILFREAENIVQEQKYGAYRANIVTYTLAYLLNRTQQRLDLQRIWKEQALSPALALAINEVSRPVHKHIVNPPAGGNVTEWCKKEACWDALRDQNIAIPSELQDELIAIGPRGAPRTGGATASDPEHATNLDRVTRVPAEKWKEMSAWAKQTKNLQPWQRSLAYSIGKLLARGGAVSPKQALQGVKILERVHELGFLTDDDAKGDVDRAP